MLVACIKSFLFQISYLTLQLKSRASEDEIKISSLSQQIRKLEDVNSRIIRESGEQIDDNQNDNIKKIKGIVDRSLYYRL